MPKRSDPDVLLLQAAADPTRLAILRQLSLDGPTCACDFTESRAVSQPTISHHLKVLRQAGWIEGERRGTWIWYSLRADAVERFGAVARGIRPGAPRPTVALGGTSTEVPDGEAEPGRTLEVIQPAWRQW